MPVLLAMLNGFICFNCAFLSFLFMCLEVFLRKWWMHFHKSKNKWERILRQETEPSLEFATPGWKELLAVSQWGYTFWFYKVRSWPFSQRTVFRAFPNSNSDRDDSNSSCALYCAKCFTHMITFNSQQSYEPDSTPIIQMSKEVQVVLLLKQGLIVGKEWN